MAPIRHGQEQVTVRRDDPDLLQPRDGVCHVLDDMIGDHHVEPSVDVLGEPFVLDDVLRIHDAVGGVPRVLGELSHQLVAREPVEVVDVALRKGWGVEGPDLENASAPDIRPVIGELASGWPPKFDPDQRAAITRIALARPGDHGLPFSTWSLSKLGDYLVAQGVVDDISHEGLQQLFRDEGVSFTSREDLEDQHRP